MAKAEKLGTTFNLMADDMTGGLGPSRGSFIAAILKSVAEGTWGTDANSAITRISEQMQKSEPHRVGKEIILDPGKKSDWAKIGVPGGPAQIRAVLSAAPKLVEAAPAPT